MTEESTRHFLQVEAETVATATSRVPCRRFGSGPALLLVHGFPLSGFTWRRVLPELAKRYTCYVPDLPGLGESQWTEVSDFSFPGQGLNLRALVDQLGLDRYSVLAQDTGGTFARYLALHDLTRVEKLVLVNTEMPHHRPPWIPLYQFLMRLPGTLPAFSVLLRSRAFLRSSMGSGGCFNDLDLIEGDFHRYVVEPLVQSAERRDGMRRYLIGAQWQPVDDLAREHSRLTMPVRLIWGADDPTFPLPLARATLPQFPRADLVEIAGARLLAHEERPVEVARAVGDFLGMTGNGMTPQEPTGRVDMREGTGPAPTRPLLRRETRMRSILLLAGPALAASRAAGASSAKTPKACHRCPRAAERRGGLRGRADRVASGVAAGRKYGSVSRRREHQCKKTIDRFCASACKQTGTPCAVRRRRRRPRPRRARQRLLRDPGDGTIVDSCTGLQWEKKTGSRGVQEPAEPARHQPRPPLAGTCARVPSLFCQPDAASAATCAALADGTTAPVQQGCSTCPGGPYDETTQPERHGPVPRPVGHRSPHHGLGLAESAERGELRRPRRLAIAARRAARNSCPPGEPNCTTAGAPRGAGYDREGRARQLQQSVRPTRSSASRWRCRRGRRPRPPPTTASPGW